MIASVRNNQVMNSSPSQVRRGGAVLMQCRLLAILLMMVILGTVDASTTVYNWSR